jgi:hypothetical protein
MDRFEDGYPIVRDALKGFSRADADRLEINYGDECIAVWAKDGTAASQTALNQAVVRLNSAFERAGWEYRGKKERGLLAWMKYRPKQ